MVRQQHIREIQSKAAIERDENKRKLSMSKKLINDSRKSVAEQRKEESRNLDRIAVQGRVVSEQEKRQKAEEEKARYVRIHYDETVC